MTAFNAPRGPYGWLIDDGFNISYDKKAYHDQQNQIFHGDRVINHLITAIHVDLGFLWHFEVRKLKNLFTLSGKTI